MPDRQRGTGVGWLPIISGLSDNPSQELQSSARYAVLHHSEFLMRRGNNRLSTLSEIYGYFRRNQTPITFLSPTPYNLLGLGRWINKFDHVNYFDSFDGTHPKITVPREHGPHEFRSIEDVNNYLLRHREVRHHIEKRGKGHLILVMLDEETEALAKELGLKIMLPPVKLRKHIDSKIITTKLGNEAGIKSAP